MRGSLLKWVAVAWVTQALSALAADEPMPPAVAVPAESMFVPLCAGPGLDGWQVRDGQPEGWKRTGEVISAVAGERWLLTRASHSDFILRFEYRLPGESRARVALRVSDDPAGGWAGTTGAAALPLEVIIGGDGSAEVVGLMVLEPAIEAPAENGQTDGTPASDGTPRPAESGVVAAATAKETVKENTWRVCEITCAGWGVIVTIDKGMPKGVRLDGPGGLRAAAVAGAGYSPAGRIGLSAGAPAEFRALAVNDLTTRTPSGLGYYDAVVGEGSAVPVNGAVVAHFTSWLAGGKRLDSTWDRGEPATVALREAIAGWSEGIPGMRVGGQRRLVVPPALGYGARGRPPVIPPEATLVFEVEVVDVRH